MGIGGPPGIGRSLPPPVVPSEMNPIREKRGKAKENMKKPDENFNPSGNQMAGNI